MSGLQTISQRLVLLDEIGQIMDSIKTIALIETQQSRSSLDSQLQGIHAMRAATQEFIQGYIPEFMSTRPSHSPRIVLVLGSERGFCGDFNARLVETLTEKIESEQLHCEVIPIGYRLWNKLRDTPNTERAISGANVAAELEGTLMAVVDVLAQTETAMDFESVSVLYHNERDGVIVFEPLLAGLLNEDAAPATAYPPLINLPPAELLKAVITEYVYSHLHYLLTNSFVAENEQRVQHLRGALDRIEEQCSALGKQRNQLRQEQITEELEIILLNGVNEEESIY